MADRILILAEHREGKIKSICWEAIGFGQNLAGRLNKAVSVVIIGDSIERIAEEVSQRCGEEVLAFDSEECRDYTPEVHCEVLGQVIQKERPHLILLGHTYQTIDFAPRLAARLGRGLISNCVDCKIEDDRLSFLRPVYNGKLHQEVGLKGDPPYLVSLQQGAFNAYEVKRLQSGRVVTFEVPLSDEILKRKVLEIVRETQGKVDLSQAEIIVAGGRGLGSKEKFQIILDLANALGAAVGASRPVTDGGWLGKEHQIGSSGQTVTPKLYIACGISGAIQHLVGMLNSGCIVAINKDPNAPIFSIADYGIVGDIFKVVPVLTELAREARE